MPFTPKVWVDGPGGGTQLNAAALTDLETRLATYTDQASSTIGQLIVFGHSRVGEGGATTEDWGVSHKLARRLNASLSLLAHGGSFLCAQEASNVPNSGNPHYGGIGLLLQFVTNTRTAAPYMPAWQTAVLDWGLNDMAWMGPTTFANVFPHGLRGAITRLRAGRIWEDTDAAFAYTGASWSNVTQTTVNSGTQVKQVTANGDLATLTIPADFPGGVLAVRFVTQANGNGALWTITGTGSCAGVNTTFDTRNINGFDNGSSIGAAGKALNSVKRLTGLPSGSGTLVITATTIQTSAQLDCVEMESPYPGPVGAGLDVKPISYATYVNWPYPGINDSDVTTIWSVANTVCAEFTDGYAFGLPLDATINKNAAWFFDGIHWNDLGHAVAADQLALILQQHAPALELTEAGGFLKPWFYPLDGSGNGAAFLNSWVNYNVAYAPGGYRKDNITGRVTINGTVTKTTGSAGDIIFTLPVGYRPATNLLFPTPIFNGTTWGLGVILVNAANGNVNVTNSGSIAAGNLNVINCSFQAEQ